jgi:hypothetical protein
MSVDIVPLPRPVALQPVEAIRRLRAALGLHGYDRMYEASSGHVAVLSVATDLTVWCHRGVYLWQSGGRHLARRADSPENTALLIARGHGRAD